MNIQQYLEKFKRITEKTTLNTMYWLMEKFQNPHKKGTVIHVAGTNGKGSCTEMLTNIFLKKIDFCRYNKNHRRRNEQRDLLNAFFCRLKSR